MTILATIGKQHNTQIMKKLATFQTFGILPVATIVAIIILNTDYLFAQNVEILNLHNSVASMTEKSTTYSYSNGEYSINDENVIRIVHFGNDGRIIPETSYDNDSTNIKKIIYDHGYIEKTYDKTGELVCKLTVDEKRHRFTLDQPNATFVCTYKESIHRPTSAKFFPCRGCRRQEGKIALFKYDKNGNIVRITNYINMLEVNGEFISSTPQRSYNPNYKYDIYFVYEYDEHENWLSRKRYNSAGALTEWLEREYVYHQSDDNIHDERDNTLDGE